VWWFGFDCGHAFDFAPGMEARMRACEAELHDDHPAADARAHRDERGSRPQPEREFDRWSQAETIDLARQFAVDVMSCRPRNT
jgi:hypothetical protein